MTRTTPRRLALAAAPALATLLLLMPPPAETQATRDVRVTESSLDERVDVSLKDADSARFFESFAHILGVELAALPGFDSTLTMEVHNVRTATALTVACESLGCLWQIEDGRLTIVEDPDAPRRPGATPGRTDRASAPELDEPIDLDLEDADLRQVLQAFGSITGTEVEVDEALGGTVTVQLHETPVRQALDALCRVHGCRWELAETDGAPVLRFSPR